MTLDEILGELSTHVGDDAQKAREAATALHGKLPSVGQILIDKGVGVAKGDATKSAKALQAALDEKDAELASVREELETVKAKTPDAASIAAQEEKRWKPKVEAAEAKAAAAIGRAVTRTREAALARLVAEAKKLGVDAEYAETILAARYADRIVPDEEGGYTVLQPGSAAPYSPPEGTTAEALLAAEVRKTVDPKWVTSNATGGAGITGPGAGPKATDAVTERIEQMNAAAAARPNPLAPRVTQTGA